MGDYSPTSADSDMLLRKMHLTKRWVTSHTLAGHDTPPVASCSFSPTAFTQQRSPLVVDTNISSPVSQLADRLTQHSLNNSTPRRVLAFSDEDDSPNSSGLADASVVDLSSVHAGFVLSIVECSAAGLATEQPTEARGRCPSAAIATTAVSYGGDYLSEDDGDDIAFAAASPAPSSVFEREPEADSRDSGVDSNDARRFGGGRGGTTSVVGPTEFTMPLAPAPRKVSVLRDADHNKMTADDGFEDMDKMVMEAETDDLRPSERLAAERMLRRPPVVNIVRSTPPIRFGLRDVTNSDFGAHHESPKSSKFPFINQRKSGMNASKPGSIFGQTRKRAKLPSPPASAAATPSAPEGKKRKHSVASSSPMQMETLKVPTELPSFSRSMSASVLEGVERESAEHMELRMQQKQVQYSLPTVSNPQIPSAAFKSISGHTLISLISSMSPEEFNSKYFLVDCRFPYEYSGGHIRHATNIYDVEKVQSIFFPDEDSDGRPRAERQFQFLRMRSRIPIFYCEFSQKRGPTMAHAVRHHDRARNEDRYPDLDYEEMYVLDRGYKKFFVDDKLKEYCDPSDYVQMRGKDHQNQLKMFQKSKSFSGSISGRPGLMSRSTKKLSFRPHVTSIASNR